MDWNQEVKGLKQARERNWWKPTAGRYNIKFLTDGEEYQTDWPTKDKDGNDTKKTINKVRFEVEINGNKYDWGVTKGITENSLYGQIALVGMNRDSLVGSNIDLAIKGKGQDMNYIVMEAVSLMAAKEEEVK